MQPVLWVYNTNLTKFSISVYLNYMYVHSLAGTFATLFGNTALCRFAWLQSFIFLAFRFVKLKGYLFIFFHDNLQKMKGMMGYMINSEILQCLPSLWKIGTMFQSFKISASSAKVSQTP